MNPLKALAGLVLLPPVVVYVVCTTAYELGLELYNKAEEWVDAHR